MGGEKNTVLISVFCGASLGAVVVGALAWGLFHFASGGCGNTIIMLSMFCPKDFAPLAGVAGAGAGAGVGAGVGFVAGRIIKLLV